MGTKRNQNRALVMLLIILSISAFIAYGSAATAEKVNGTLENEVSPQISGQMDKYNMTEAEKKLSTDLLDLVKATKVQSSTGPTLNSNSEERVYVYVYLYKGNSTKVIEPIVQEITNRDENNSVAVAWVSVSKLEELASLKEVKNIRSVIPPVLNNGSATTKENASNNTGTGKTSYLEDGNWIKLVGIVLFTAMVFRRRSK